MTWILLVYLSWNQPAVTTARFPTQESCEAAGKWFHDNAYPAHVQTACFNDDVNAAPKTAPENPSPFPDAGHPQ